MREAGPGRATCVPPFEIVGKTCSSSRAASEPNALEEQVPHFGCGGLRLLWGRPHGIVQREAGRLHDPGPPQRDTRSLAQATAPRPRSERARGESEWRRATLQVSIGSWSGQTPSAVASRDVAPVYAAARS